MKQSQAIPAYDTNSVGLFKGGIGMSKQPDKDELNTEHSVLAPHVSDDELKEQKAQEKAAIRTRKQAQRQAIKKELQERNPTLKFLVILVIILVVGGVALGIIGSTGVLDAFLDPKGVNDKLGHFYSSDSPELSEEGIKGVITEAYYTNDGHLAVVLQLSNGLNTNHHMTSLSVSVSNEDGKVVATGYTDKIKDSYYIEPMGYNTFTFYISPKYVKITDDDLDQLTYEIKTTGSVEDESVLKTTTTTAATTTTAG